MFLNVGSQLLFFRDFSAIELSKIQCISGRLKSQLQLKRPLISVQNKIDMSLVYRKGLLRTNNLHFSFGDTCVRNSGLPVGSHGIVVRRAQKSGHQLAASPYWITSSGLASVTFHVKKPSF